jgi:hypothetical protein
MTPESRNGSLLGNAEGNARNNRRAVFSAVGAALVATQRCGKHISATVNQHATPEEAAPRLYNEDLKKLESQNYGSLQSWQL